VCGSRLWGTATPQSDLDCVVVHGIPPGGGATAEAVSSLGSGKKGNKSSGPSHDEVVTTSLSGGYFDVSLVSAAAFERRCVALQQAPFLQYLCAPDHCLFYGGVAAGNDASAAAWLASLRQLYRPDASLLAAQMAHSAGKDTARVAKLLAAPSPDAVSVAKAAKIAAHAVRLAAVCHALLLAASPPPHGGSGNSVAVKKSARATGRGGAGAAATFDGVPACMAASTAIRQLSVLPPCAARLCEAIRHLADGALAPPLVAELSRILDDLQRTGV